MIADEPLKIETAEGKTPEMRIIEVTGPITLPNIFIFQDELRRSEPPARIVLDLSGVPYMDSAGLGAVVNYYTHCERRGKRMALAGVSSRVRELFRMTRVDTVIPILASSEESF